MFVNILKNDLSWTKKIYSDFKQCIYYFTFYIEFNIFDLYFKQLKFILVKQIFIKFEHYFLYDNFNFLSMHFKN